MGTHPRRGYRRSFTSQRHGEGRDRLVVHTPPPHPLAAMGGGGVWLDPPLPPLVSCPAGNAKGCIGVPTCPPPLRTHASAIRRVNLRHPPPSTLSGTGGRGEGVDTGERRLGFRGECRHRHLLGIPRPILSCPPPPLPRSGGGSRPSDLWAPPAPTVAHGPSVPISGISSARPRRSLAKKPSLRISMMWWNLALASWHHPFYSPSYRAS